MIINEMSDMVNLPEPIDEPVKTKWLRWVLISILIAAAVGLTGGSDVSDLAAAESYCYQLVEAGVRPREAC